MAMAVGNASEDIQNTCLLVVSFISRLFSVAFQIILVIFAKTGTIAS